MAESFEKVGECLYRYTGNGTYYARFEVGGKEVRRSLRTMDKPLARRRLADLQRDLARVDLSARKFTLAKMCERYLATVQSQKPKTVKRKREIAARLLRDFPGGADVPVSRILPSKVGAWLVSYDFGPASYNLYLEFVRAVFALAVEDNVLASSPSRWEASRADPADAPTARTPTGPMTAGSCARNCARGITPKIARRGQAHGSGLGVYRCVAEQVQAWLLGFKRLRTRYGRTAFLPEAFLSLACCLICYRHR